MPNAKDVDIGSGQDELASRTRSSTGDGDNTDPGAGSKESPGADLFKRWLWLPGPIALTYLVTVVVRGVPSGADPFWIIAAIACLPAQALAWSWASHQWLHWTDWKFFSAVALVGISLASIAVAIAGKAHPSADTTFRIGLRPNDVVATADALWVSDTLDEVIYRVPNDEEQSMESIPVARAFELATDGSTVWVSQASDEGENDEPPGLTRLRSDGSIAGTYLLPDHPSDVAATERSVWLAFVYSGQIGRLDTTSGELSVWRVGEAPASLAIDGRSVWVTDIVSKTVSRIDAETGVVSESFETGETPVGIDAQSERIWITNADSDTVTYYDAEHQIRTQFRVPAVPTDISIREDTLWIVSQEAQMLIAVDARTGESKREIALDGKPNRLEVVGSDVFVASPDDGIVQRFAAVNNSTD